MSKKYEIITFAGTDVTAKKVRLSEKEIALIDTPMSADDESIHVILLGGKKKNIKTKEHGHTVLDKKGIKNLIEALQDTLKELD